MHITDAGFIPSPAAQPSSFSSASVTCSGGHKQIKPWIGSTAVSCALLVTPGVLISFGLEDMPMSFTSPKSHVLQKFFRFLTSSLEFLDQKKNW